MPDTQISAHISTDTKARLDRYVRSTGVTRGHVIEQALLHYLQVLDEIPPDAVVPARIVLSRASAEKVRDRIQRPGRPTEAMKRLFRDR